MRDQNDPGDVNPDFGTDLGSAGAPPAAYVAPCGGSLPRVHRLRRRLSRRLQRPRRRNLRLTIRVPTSAQPFSDRYRFVSAGSSQWSCTPCNDHNLARLTSGAPGFPADHTIAIHGAGNAITVRSPLIQTSVPQGCSTCPMGSVWLAGNRHADQLRRRGPAWVKVTGPVVPGATIVLDLMVFDVSDPILNSIVLLDGFPWDPPR
jgi:hypothetical protein